jgi:2-(1,2-epoxy-1,2-dihydrophenyl)acetyl-CoA isomerase
VQFPKIIFDRKEKTAIIRLNRPKEFNALDFELTVSLAKALEVCREDADIRAVVITGAGKAFCSGGDVAMFGGAEDKGEAIRQLVELLHNVVAAIRLIPKPVIAAVNGVAAGGGFSMAAACDLRIAASSAKFKQAYTSIGLAPDGGWSMTVPLLIGFGKATELAFLDPAFDAKKALEWGLVHRVVDDGELEKAAMDMALKLSRGPADAFAVVKENLRRSMMGLLEQQLELERRGMHRVGRTADAAEGITAFVEKREPRFGAL